MDVPVRLDAWTFQTIETVVAHHEFEPSRFDYKEVLNPSGQGKGDHTASIRRTTCSMANGDGGYILFGVKDRNSPVATPQQRVVGIALASDLRKEYGEKLATIQRDVYFETKAISLPTDATKGVFVVYIPTSPLRPHIDTSVGKFEIRGEGGSARAMSFFEVRDQMLYTEGRMQKVTLLRFELAAFRAVVTMQSEPTTRSVRFDTSTFKVLLADICDMLQAGSNLLGFLHEIGSRAVILNHLLDRRAELEGARLDNLGIFQANMLRQDVLDRLAQLSNDCGKVEERLAAVFGSLKTS